MEKFGVVYHPLKDGALSIAHKIEAFLNSRGLSPWLCSAWDGEALRVNLLRMDCAITIGGDGTILRTAQAITPHSIPIIGVNLGEIGFLTEIAPNEIIEKLSIILDGGGWIDERAMLEARLIYNREEASLDFYILNDIVIARGEIARIINIEASIDGTPLTMYKADGVIVATATGSTGYSIAAGGPILHPKDSHYLLVPIMAHFSFSKILIIPSESVVELKIAPIHKAVLSIDGHISLPMGEGDTVEIKHSAVKTKFLRIKPGASFYSTLEQKLKR
ncbi:MAG: NAD(+)/NADH kinase [Dehalococcoidales bacterium]|nr:NAD(+)/NADH kinase [Dehalococcoidales bacterium]